MNPLDIRFDGHLGGGLMFLIFLPVFVVFLKNDTFHFKSLVLYFKSTFLNIKALAVAIPAGDCRAKLE